MDAKAFQRVIEAGQLSWEERNPISYLYFSTAANKPKDKVILNKSYDLDTFRGVTITALLRTLKHGDRDYVMAGTEVLIPVSEFGPTELFWYGSEPVISRVGDIDIVVEMPTATQIVAIYFKNGEINSHLYYSL